MADFDGIAARLSGMGADLQEVSAWLGRIWRDDMPAAVFGGHFDQGENRLRITFYARDAQQFADLTRALAVGAPKGAVTKVPDNDYMDARRMFGNLQVRISIHRESVCERTQVGTRTEMRPVWPDGEGGTSSTPPDPVGDEEVEVPVYEWDCGPVLANADTEAAG